MRIVMMGTGSFAEPTFAALLQGPHEVVGLFTQPDRATGKERGSTRQAQPGMKIQALGHHIPVLQPESINTPEGVASSARAGARSARGRRVRPDPVERRARRRGAWRHQRACVALAEVSRRGADQLGDLPRRDEDRRDDHPHVHALDAGDILAQEAVDIRPEETAGELEARLGPLGAKLAANVVERIATGEPVPGVKQDKSQVTKAPKLTKEHGLIDWTRTAEQVCNHIRAMQPWPTRVHVSAPRGPRADAADCAQGPDCAR